jgi:murein endopeptidase
LSHLDLKDMPEIYIFCCSRCQHATVKEVLTSEHDGFFHLLCARVATAHDPAVIRILVNAAIKKALCREAGADRA